MAKLAVEGKEVITTDSQDAHYSPTHDKTSLSSCNYKETDTRMILDAADAFSRGFTEVLICTIDTDVAVFAVTYVQRIQIPELWIGFVTSQHLRYLLMTQFLHLAQTSQRLYQHFMPILVALQCLPLLEKERSPHGSPLKALEDAIPAFHGFV